MKRAWITPVVLWVASRIIPTRYRAEWVREWRSELFYVSPEMALRFSWGAFPDALWVRRNVAERRGVLASPTGCLAFLGILAIAAGLGAVALEARLPFPSVTGWALSQGFAAFVSLYALLALLAFAFGDYVAASGSPPRRCRVRGWVFLTLKLVLVLPVIHFGFLAIVICGPLGTLVFLAGTILLLRWVFRDQRTRCPICLHLLEEPVRIGSASATFLHWYGSESICRRGHGVLHVSERTANDKLTVEWITLDDSWSGLFR